VYLYYAIVVHVVYVSKYTELTKADYFDYICDPELLVRENFQERVLPNTSSSTRQHQFQPTQNIFDTLPYQIHQCKKLHHQSRP
jgi:hypothetical protein